MSASVKWQLLQFLSMEHSRYPFNSRLWCPKLYSSNALIEKKNLHCGSVYPENFSFAWQSMSTYNHLTHLDECQTCKKQRMTIPLMCTGHHKPENTGAWYQKVCYRLLICAAFCILILKLLKCLDNPGPCTGYKWCSDRPRGLPPLHERNIICPGWLCAQRPKALAGSTTCYLGLCLKCCVLAHKDTSSIPPCAERRHHAACSKSQPEHPTMATVPGTSAISPTHQVPAKPKTFATPLSLTYQQKLHALDNEHLANVTTAAATWSYERQKTKTVTVYWWSKVSTDFHSGLCIYLIKVRMIQSPTSWM